jgi:hypothetical protein
VFGPICQAVPSIVFCGLRSSMHSNRDVLAFLSLTNLAKYGDPSALQRAQEFFPGTPVGDLLDLAYETAKERNRNILLVASRVAPARKVSCWSQDGSHAQSILECGHTVRIKLSQIARPSRCRRCLKEENREIVRNFSGQAEHTTG